MHMRLLREISQVGQGDQQKEKKQEEAATFIVCMNKRVNALVYYSDDDGTG